MGIYCQVKRVFRIIFLRSIMTVLNARINKSIVLKT